MRYKVGDKVYLRDDLEHFKTYGQREWSIFKLDSCIVTIRNVLKEVYELKEDKKYEYTDEMIDHKKTAELSTDTQDETPDDTPYFDQSDARECDLTKDNVNHPLHYTQGSYEVIDVITDVTRDMVGIEAVCVGNIIKYVARYKHKNGIEDLEKAQWYLTRLIESMKD